MIVVIQNMRILSHYIGIVPSLLVYTPKAEKHLGPLPILVTG